MREEWWLLELDTGFPTAVVLDASTSAEPHWDAIQAFTSQLLEALPRREHALYFLGNPEQYAVAELARYAATWFEANRRRVSLVTPLFEQLQDSGAQTVVVLAAGRLFDIEDWLGTPLMERTCLVRFGSESLTGDSCTELEPSLDNLQRRLTAPIARVEIGGPGVMPFFWDNPAYGWCKDRLVAEKTDRFTAQIGMLSPLETPPQAFATRASGVRHPVSLRPWLAPAVNGWKELTASEASAFYRGLAGNKVRCPTCRAPLAPFQVRCDRGVLGHLLYPSLQGFSGFALFRVEGAAVQFRRHPSPALRLAPDVVAICTGGTAEVYRYDAAARVWTWVRHWQGLERLTETEYALVV